MLELRKRADKSGSEPAEGESWPLDGVELVGEAPKQHNFADTFVQRAMEEGWLSFEDPTLVHSSVEFDGKPIAYPRDPTMTGKAIVLKLGTGELRYTVKEPPGIYEEKGGPPRVSNEYACTLSTKKGSK